MTEDEASKVCEVIATADGGCENCVRNLLAGLMETLPEVGWARVFSGLPQTSYWVPSEVAAQAASDD